MEFKGVPVDPVLVQLAEYAQTRDKVSPEAERVGVYAAADALACHLHALQYANFRRRFAPLQKSAVERGCPLPGTKEVLGVFEATRLLSEGVRWLDWDDTYLKSEWGHPADCAGLWAIHHFLSFPEHGASRFGKGQAVAVRDVIHAMVRSYEIQGTLQETNACNARGIDHPQFLRVGIACVAADLFGGSLEQIVSACSHAWSILTLRAHRHGDNAGQRKSWSAAESVVHGLDYAHRAVHCGEPMIPQVLSQKDWGFQDTVYSLSPEKLEALRKKKGVASNEITLARPLGSVVMENILFKVVPTEYHAQTLAEAMLAVRDKVMESTGGDWSKIDAIQIDTHNDFVRILDKGFEPLTNFAARDHDGRYIGAAFLANGASSPEIYTDEWAAAHPEVEELRRKMAVTEVAEFTSIYGQEGAVPNRVTITLKDGTKIGPQEQRYPLGSPKMREEGLKAIQQKVERSFREFPDYSEAKAEQLVALMFDQERFLGTPVTEFMDMLAADK